MKYNLEEVQNYLEYLYHNIDNETENINISVDILNDLREMFNCCIVFLTNSTRIQSNISLGLVASLVMNLLFLFIFVFKI